MAFRPVAARLVTMTAVQTADGGGGEDWAASAADRIERVIGSVRAKTADPLEAVARILVYGLLAAVVGTAAAVLVAVGLVRGLITVIDLVWTREVWLAHLVTGGIFTVAGVFLWRKRSTKTVKV